MTNGQPRRARRDFLRVPRIMRLFTALSIGALLLMAITGTWANGTRDRVETCAEATTCVSCAEYSFCGWCGGVSGGRCVPGGNDVSSIVLSMRHAYPGMDVSALQECPSSLYRGTVQTCEEVPQRELRVLDGANAAQARIVSLERTRHANVSTLDVAVFTIGQCTDGNGDVAFCARCAYKRLPRATVDEVATNPATSLGSLADWGYSMNGLHMFDNADGAGFRGIGDLDRLIAGASKRFDSWAPIAVAQGTSAQGVTTMRITSTLSDGSVSILCDLASSSFQSDGRSRSPYSFDCTMVVNDWSFVPSGAPDTAEIIAYGALRQGKATFRPANITFVEDAGPEGAVAPEASVQFGPLSSPIGQVSFGTRALCENALGSRYVDVELAEPWTRNENANPVVVTLGWWFKCANQGLERLTWDPTVGVDPASGSGVTSFSAALDVSEDVGSVSAAAVVGIILAIVVVFTVLAIIIGNHLRKKRQERMTALLTTSIRARAMRTMTERSLQPPGRESGLDDEEL